ncbi:MAG: peptidoglycan-binding domain-containing protein [Candidatus Pacebacteria bacterium]|nr:peptidoglycan-binding domain-containing protein [Candidatus Paceibacterota bacterium]
MNKLIGDRGGSVTLLALPVVFLASVAMAILVGGLIYDNNPDSASRKNLLANVSEVFLVASPKGGEQIQIGTTFSVKTIIIAEAQEIKYTLYKDGNLIGELVGVKSSDLEFLWSAGQYKNLTGQIVTADAGEGYLIGLTGADTSEPFATAEDVFTLTAASTGGQSNVSSGSSAVSTSVQSSQNNQTASTTQNGSQQLLSEPETTSEPIFTYTWNKDLYYGLKNNDDVEALQSVLILEGCYNGPITGNFYSKTRTAVKCFQKKHGFTTIPASGRVGPYTRSILNEIY